ncbi:VC0807 family protein [Plantactinospora alkalitolerans]|nr:VC0807 family protein [Plantactinospora alkalitolerans]
MRRLRGLLLNWAPTLICNVLLPALTYSMLTDRGVSSISALAISAIWPAVEVVALFAIRRRIDEFGVLTLILIALGVGSSLALQDARLALVKESAATGLFGLLLLGSLLMPRPLMFYFGRKFATDGSAERVDWWNGLWRYEGFRRTQRVLTVVWGVTFVVEAAGRIELSQLLPVRTMVTVSAVLPYVIIAGLVTWTIFYTKRARARAAQLNPAALAEPAV